MANYDLIGVLTDFHPLFEECKSFSPAGDCCNRNQLHLSYADLVISHVVWLINECQTQAVLGRQIGFACSLKSTRIRLCSISTVFESSTVIRREALAILSSVSRSVTMI